MRPFNTEETYAEQALAYSARLFIAGGFTAAGSLRSSSPHQFGRNAARPDTISYNQTQSNDELPMTGRNHTRDLFLSLEGA